MTPLDDTKNNDWTVNPFAAVPIELSISAMGPVQLSELARALISAMMLAQTFDMCTTARTIYDAVVLLVDDVDKVKLCLAFSGAIRGDMQYAKALRQSGFSGSADEDRKNLMLSFVLSLNDEDDWRSVPRNLIETSSDPNILRSARLMLDS
jgi:hypothetical protein